MSDRKAPLPPLQRLSVGTPRSDPNPLEVLDQDALLQIRNALIDVDAPESVCEKWNLWCTVSKAAREHLDMCTNPDDGSWQEACRLLGLIEKPVIPGEEAKTWRQWLRRLCDMASDIEAYGRIGYWWYRELCREVRTEKRFKNEPPGMDPPHRWRLRCAGKLSYLNLRGQITMDDSHEFLIESLCLQFGDADALGATQVWGPQVDMMFFPKTDPNEPGFLEGKMERREYAIAAGANVSEVLYAGFPDTGPELNPETGAFQFYLPTTGCWSDEEAWYVPDIESVRMLLDAGAVPSGNPERHVRESEYYTLLMHAAWAGDVALCELLLERGADINAIHFEASPPIGEHPTALAYAVDNASVGRGDAVGTVRALLARNPVLTAFDPEKTMLTYWAGCAEQDDPEDVARVVEVGRLLARHAGGVMLNQQDAYGNTALHMLNVTLDSRADDAAVPMLRLLLDEGADVSLVNRSGETPLIDAVQRGVDDDAMGLLIRASAEAGVLDVQNSVGDTALHLTHDNGKTDWMRLLLDAGADPNVQNDDGQTLLHHMAEEGITEYVRHEDVEALLNAGADPNLIDEKGWTPAHYAGEGMHKDMLRLLLENGAEGVDKFDYFDEWTDDEDF